MSLKSKSKIAYLILAHTDPQQLERLVHAINYKSRIFIHLDAKSEIEDFEHIRLPVSAEFINDRIKVSWGGISVVDATINLIKAALDAPESFSRLVLLSGQDYPIKPIHKIYECLSSQPNKQFIRFLDMVRSPYHSRRASRYYFWEPLLTQSPTVDKNLRLTLMKLGIYLSPFVSRKPPKNMKLAFGSQWWALTPSCGTYIIDFLSENPEFRKFYTFSHAPDEQFFHTLVANSPYLSQTEGFQENVELPALPKLSNLHIVCLDKYFDEQDYSNLRSSDKFFVRKVSSESSTRLLDLVDRNLLAIQSEHRK